MSTQTLNGHADKVASKIDDQCFTGTGSRYVTPVSVMCRLRDSVQSLERENVSLRHTITLLEKVVVGMEVEMVCSCNAEELRQAREENARLRVAIERALADSESGDGWGPTSRCAATSARLCRHDELHSPKREEFIARIKAIIHLLNASRQGRREENL